jgi:hypothetical protein
MTAIAAPCGTAKDLLLHMADEADSSIRGIPIRKQFSCADDQILRHCTLIILSPWIIAIIPMA